MDITITGFIVVEQERRTYRHISFATIVVTHFASENQIKMLSYV